MSMFHYYFRKIFPFLYIRNWYSGQFEISTSRLVVFVVVALLVVLFCIVAYTLGKPVSYSK